MGDSREEWQRGLEPLERSVRPLAADVSPQEKLNYSTPVCSGTDLLFDS